MTRSIDELLALREGTTQGFWVVEDDSIIAKFPTLDWPVADAGPEDVHAIAALPELFNALERMRDENTKLREALQPFADKFLWPDDLGFEYAEDIRSDEDFDEDSNGMVADDVFVLRRDIQKARAALANRSEGDE